MLEMGEDEGRTGDLADFAGADCDVLQCPPAAGEQGEAAFAQAAQRPLDNVAGAGIEVEFLTTGRLPHRDVDADPGSLVSRVGQRRQTGCGCRVEREEHVGDAWRGNLLRDENDIVLADWDAVSTGPAKPTSSPPSRPHGSSFHRDLQPL